MSRESLIGWADAQRGKAFKWGHTDCGTMVRKAAKKMHGTDPFKVPDYKSKAKALRTFAECGGIAAALAKVASPVGRGFAQIGDIALLEDETALANSLMIVIDKWVLVSEPDTGVTLRDRSTLPISTSFWRIHA